MENTDLVRSDSDRLIGTDGTLQIGVSSGLKGGMKEWNYGTHGPLAF